MSPIYTITKIRNATQTNLIMPDELITHSEIYPLIDCQRMILSGKNEQDDAILNLSPKHEEGLDH